MNVTAGQKVQQAIAFAVAGFAAGSMPAPLEHDPIRDAALRKIAPVAGQRGWSLSVLRDVAGPDADLLFPGGAVEMVEAWSDLCDREMVAAILSSEEPRLSQRVKQALMVRLPANDAMRSGARAGFGVLAAPCAGGAMRRTLLRTVNAIWHAAQDESSGVTYLTKRVTLSGIYTAALLFWLARGKSGDAMEAFIDRRLAGVLRFGKFKAQLLGRFGAGGAASASSAR